MTFQHMLPFLSSVPQVLTRWFASLKSAAAVGAIMILDERPNP